MRFIRIADPDSCTGCKSCEVACSNAYYKTEDHDLSCIKIETDGIHACTQCGMCMKVCPASAITLNKRGIYMINRKTCIGCLACMDICPENAICKSWENVFATKCTVCGLCVKACPNDVLEIAES